MDSMSANPMGNAAGGQTHRPAYDPIAQPQCNDSSAATNGSIHANEAPMPAANQDTVVASGKDSSKKEGGVGAEGSSASVNNDLSVKKEASNGATNSDERNVEGSDEGKLTPHSPKKSSILADDEPITEEKYQETMRKLRTPIYSTLVLFKELNVSKVWCVIRFATFQDIS